MPLMGGKSQKAFGQNVSSEISAGKPQKQALAIAYAVKRRGKKMADGGSYDPKHVPNSPSAADAATMARIFGGKADGGEIEPGQGMKKKMEDHGLLDAAGEWIDKQTGNAEKPKKSLPTGSPAGSDTGAKRLGEGWSAAGFAEGGSVDEDEDMMRMHQILEEATADEEPEDLKGKDADQSYAMGGMHPKRIAHMIMSKNMAHGGEAADDFLAPDVEQDEPLDSDDEEHRHKRILHDVMNGLHKKHYGK